MTRRSLCMGLTLICPVFADRDGALRAYERHDFRKALRYWEELAKKGDAEAEFELGSMYQRGEGTHPDQREAMSWYWKAAYQGFAKAQSVLGMLYAAGQTVPKDLVQAHYWLSLASRGGLTVAAEKRDELQQNMSASEIKEAQRLVGRWEPAAEPGHGVSPPVVIQRTDPDDQTTRLAGYAGTVMLYVVVDSGGKPRDIFVYRGISREADARVARTVSQWVFRPGQKNGQAAAAQATVEVSFQRVP